LAFPIKIFISSVMNDLNEVRKKISVTVVESENVPIMAENFVNVTNSPRYVIESKVDECDAYIGIFDKYQK
jgi:hypothetical protein